MGFNDILKDKVKDIDTVLNEYLPACTGRQKQVLDAMGYSVSAVSYTHLTLPTKLEV